MLASASLRFSMDASAPTSTWYSSGWTACTPTRAIRGPSWSAPCSTRPSPVTAPSGPRSSTWCRRETWRCGSRRSPARGSSCRSASLCRRRSGLACCRRPISSRSRRVRPARPRRRCSRSLSSRATEGRLGTHKLQSVRFRIRRWLWIPALAGLGRDDGRQLLLHRILLQQRILQRREHEGERHHAEYLEAYPEVGRLRAPDDLV